MKRIFLTGILLLPLWLSANQCHFTNGGELSNATYNGSVSCTHAIINNIKVNGALTMKNTVQTGTLIVNGAVNMQNTKADTININGKLTANNVVISGPLTINASDIKMTNTTTKNIEVKSKRDTVKLLLNNTVIKGNISFASGKGVIIMDRQSKILGNVSGGRIERR